MFVILDDGGLYTSINIWFRKTIDGLEPTVYSGFRRLPAPDLRVLNLNAKRVILALLQHFSAKILPIAGSNRGIWLFTVVEVSEKEAEAVKKIARAKITLKDTKKMVEKPTAKEILKYLALRRLLT